MLQQTMEIKLPRLVRHGTSDVSADQETRDWIYQQAKFGTPIWAVCSYCENTDLVFPEDLLHFVRADRPGLSELNDRLQCTVCGRKSCELTPAAPIPEYAA